MVQDDVTIDKYELYEALFDPAWAEPHGRQRKKVNHQPKRSQAQILAELTDDLSDVDLGFQHHLPALALRVGLAATIAVDLLRRGPHHRRAGPGQGRQGGQRLPLRAAPGHRPGPAGGQGLSPAHVPQPAQRRDVPPGARDPDGGRQSRGPGRMLHRAGHPKQDRLWHAGCPHVVADARVHGHGAVVPGRRRRAAAHPCQRQCHPDGLCRRRVHGRADAQHGEPGRATRRSGCSTRCCAT